MPILQASSGIAANKKKRTEIDLIDDFLDIEFMAPYIRNGRNYNIPLNVSKLVYVLILLLMAGMVGGCALPGSTKPVVKIGLIAPFEGEQRSDGYQRLYGVKLALQEANLSGGVAGAKIELVALNDENDKAETILQAQELVIDSKIVAVVGNWDKDLFDVALPVYHDASLAVINPTLPDEALNPGSSFEADYQSLAGSAPDEQAEQAYVATVKILQLIEASGRQKGRITRDGVFEALNNVGTMD